jgi:hypothetical protein
MSNKKKSKKYLRVVWADGISETDLKDLTKEVKIALSNSSHSIVTNYEVNWDLVEIDEHPEAVLLVFAPRLNEKDIKGLVAQVEKSISDPDYVIVTNYQVIVKFVNHTMSS